eukprot:52853-Chlamydomonas_euryale.AAC.8
MPSEAPTTVILVYRKLRPTARYAEVWKDACSSTKSSGVTGWRFECSGNGNHTGRGQVGQTRGHVAELQFELKLCNPVAFLSQSDDVLYGHDCSCIAPKPPTSHVLAPGDTSPHTRGAKSQASFPCNLLRRNIPGYHPQEQTIESSCLVRCGGWRLMVSGLGLRAMNGRGRWRLASSARFRWVSMCDCMLTGPGE